MGGILSKNDFKSAFPEPTKYDFRRSDSETCRASFTDLQEWYHRDYEKFVLEETQLHNMHSEILRKIKKYDIRLVNNRDFIRWAITTPNPDHLEGTITDIFTDAQNPEEVMQFGQNFNAGHLDLGPWTASYFYEEDGAKPIDTEEALSFALDAMFHYRG